MVQGSEPKFAAAPKQELPDSKTAKKPAFNAPSKSSQEAAGKSKSKDYGAWGPTFKNKDNFKNMHMY